MRRLMIAGGAALVLMTAGGGGPGMAATAACKAVKEQTGCTTRADCVWVKGHTMKMTGKQVAAFCRAKPKPKAKAS